MDPLRTFNIQSFFILLLFSLYVEKWLIEKLRKHLGTFIFRSVFERCTNNASVYRLYRLYMQLETIKMDNPSNCHDFSIICILFVFNRLK